jgi:FixJ family two-component response regulator
MRSGQLTVYIVEDDASVRDSLALMLGLAGYQTAAFADAESFISAVHPGCAGCLITDLRLPGMSGLELQAALRRTGHRLPVVVITAHGDVATAREAFLERAVDFLEKPFDDAQLRAAIENAFGLEIRRLRDSETGRADAGKLARLTQREREVLACAARGLHAKEIAAELGISPRTVEVHKTRLMGKLEVRNVAELVRFALSVEKQGTG